MSRFICHSELYDMDLHIDINTDLFPLEVGLRTEEGGVGGEEGAGLGPGRRGSWGVLCVCAWDPRGGWAWSRWLAEGVRGGMETGPQGGRKARDCVSARVCVCGGAALRSWARIC